MSKRKIEKGKILDSMDKTNMAPHLTALGAVLAMWLHIRAPQKIQEKQIYKPFKTKITTDTYGVRF
jgi:hypothetical protein